MKTQILSNCSPTASVVHKPWANFVQHVYVKTESWFAQAGKWNEHNKQIKDMCGTQVT